MKRKSVIILVLVLFLTLAVGIGCKNESEPVNIVVQPDTPNVIDEDPQDAGTSAPDSNTALGPDTPEPKEMISFTVPGFYYLNRSYSKVINEAQEAGHEAHENRDGSITFIMTQEQHIKLLNDARKNINDLIDQMIREEDYWGITDIESNDDYNDIKVFCTENINEYDNQSISRVWGLGYYTGLYQTYLGKEDDARSVITVIDVSTNKIYSTVITPDDMST